MSLQRLGLLLILHLGLLQITGCLASDCPLDFLTYPYQPSGQCIHKAEKMEQWGGVHTDRCCSTALATLTQALALEANATLSLFLPQSQWKDCESQAPTIRKSSSITHCRFQHLHIADDDDDDACSRLNLTDLQDKHQEKYNELLSKCSQFTAPSFNETCSGCSQAIKEMLPYFKETLEGRLVEKTCMVAVVVAIAAARIRNVSWVSDFYSCLLALDRDVDYFKINRSVAKVTLAIFIAIVVLTLIVVVIQCVVGESKKKKRKQTDTTTEKGRYRTATWSGLYSFSRLEIERAMSCGSQRECLGAGSAGRVYKGILPSGQIVAIKHIYKSNHSDSFTREVEGLSRIRHPNLVCLFGCCVDGGDLFLVYEFCPNGNLAQHLLRNDNVPSWETRVTIMRHCALALRFLHNYPDGCIVHRDIKLTNILLVEKMEPKLSDFGLAKMLGMEESKVFTDVRGTIGYMDPEYMINAKLTSSSDVYSFGIVMLQILSGRRVIELDLDARDHLTRKAKDVVMGKRPVSDFVDPRINGQPNMDHFVAILHIAVLCVAKSSKGRPTMVVVFEELEKVWKKPDRNVE